MLYDFSSFDSSPPADREYLEALAGLDREFPAAPALTQHQAFILETHFGVLCDAAWDGGLL